MNLKLSVVGGFYREVCIEPAWDAWFGSGGRAACAANKASPHVEVELWSPVRSGRPSAQFQMLAERDGIRVRELPSSAAYRFDYRHPLSQPLFGAPSSDKGQTNSEWPSLESRAALVFGMLEGSVKVNAEYLVYDPQSPDAPVRPEELGLQWKKLAVVCNEREARALGATGDTCLALSRSLATIVQADVTIVKFGARGAALTESGESKIIPPLPSPRVFSIGSGDVFSGIFAAYWAAMGTSSIEAATVASAAVAKYVETKCLDDLCVGPTAQPTLGDLPTQIGGRVYLAGPFFDEGQRWLVDELRRALMALGTKVFSPLHDVGRGDTGRIYKCDIDGIRSCDVLFAILHQSDPGTVYEVGYAAALDKPIVGLVAESTGESLKMIRGANATLCEDIASAVYQTAWALAGLGK